MFRLTPVARKINPFSLYMREFAKTKKGGMGAAAKAYKKLSPAQKAALVKRAQQVPDRNGAAYRRFAKQTWKQLSSLPPAERRAKMTQMWKAKKPKKVNPSKTQKATKPKKAGAARRSVKKAAAASKRK